MSSPDAPRIALAPDTAPDWLAEAIADGGGHLVPLSDADGIIWADPRDPAALEAALPTAGNATWVQLPFAGIENFVHLIDDDHVWTCGKGVYAEPVAELALALGLAGLRGIGQYARSSDLDPSDRTQPARWTGQHPRRWRDRRVARPPAATVRLPRHGRAPERSRHGRRRRRARSRPLPRCTRGRRSGGAGAGADARDRGDHRPAASSS